MPADDFVVRIALPLPVPVFGAVTEGLQARFPNAKILTAGSEELRIKIPADDLYRDPEDQV